MNGGGINGAAVNGAGSPAWVIRGIVAAVALAVVTATPIRVLGGASVASAAASVAAPAYRIALAGVVAQTSTSSALFPNLHKAAHVSATSAATGNASVRRDVYAEAGGDCAAIGFAYASDALGEATATAGGTVTADAHRILPASSNTTAVLTAVLPAGDVARYALINDLTSQGSGYAEASTKLSGSSVWLLDGFSNATARCTVAVAQDYMAVIAHYGVFDFAQSTGSAATFVRFTARASASGEVTGLASARRVQALHATGSAGATTVEADALRTSSEAVNVVGESYSLLVPASANYRAWVATSVDGTAQAVGQTNYGARALLLGTATGEATQAVQHYGLANASAEATSGLVAHQTNYGARVLAEGTATGLYANTGWQRRASATASAGSDAQVEGFITQYGQTAPGASADCSSAVALVQYVARAVAFGNAALDVTGVAYRMVSASASSTATAANVSVTLYGRAESQSGSDAQAVGVRGVNAAASAEAIALVGAVADLRRRGFATAFSSATGSALGFANSEIRAPASRVMRVTAQIRSATIPAQIRTMRVP